MAKAAVARTIRARIITAFSDYIDPIGVIARSSRAMTAKCLST
jgi:hypothetical protein